MIPVTQTKVVVKNSKGEFVVHGNCYAAAIASMLELPITEVPNVELFFSGDEDVFWDTIMSNFLRRKGYELVDGDEYKIFHPEYEPRHHAAMDEGLRDLLHDMGKYKDDFYFVSGDSPRGVKHICIYKEGVMVHDPHPTREGILNHLWFQKLVRI